MISSGEGGMRAGLHLNFISIFSSNFLPTELSGVLVGSLTYNHEAVGSTPNQITVKWLALGWVTVCRQVNHLGI